MIENRLRKCCETCLYADIRADTNKLYNAGGEIVNVETKIYCIHEKICKNYTEGKHKYSIEHNPPSIKLIKYATERGIVTDGYSTESLLKKIYEKEKKIDN